MPERKVTIKDVAIRYDGNLCGDADFNPCECLVYNSELEPYCFKFTGTLKQSGGDAKRCQKCKEEYS